MPLFSSKESNFKISLGSTVTDKITGYTGIVVCRTQWLYNCNVYGVKSEELKDGKPQPAEYFDEPQLVMKEVEVIEPNRKTGGPSKSVPQTNR